MKYAIVYSSITGNTKMLADALKKTLPDEGCIYFGEPDIKALEADRIYAGFWTYKGSCDDKTAEFLKELTDQEVYLFGTAGFGGDQKYFDRVLENTEKNLGKAVRITGRFMCQGKMPLTVRKRYEQMQACGGEGPDPEMMIANFDRALSHPDEDDIKALVRAVRDR